jgi:hypothetical protein
MNSEDKLNELFRAARENPPTDRGDLGFETRLLARLREERSHGALEAIPGGDVLALAVWRALPWFGGLVAAFALVVFLTSPDSGLLDLALTPDELVLFLTGH